MELLLDAAQEDGGEYKLLPRLRVFSSSDRFDVIGFPPKRFVLIVPGGGYHLISEREISTTLNYLLPRNRIAAVLTYRTAPTKFPYPQLDFIYALSLLSLTEIPAIRAAVSKGVELFAMSAGAHLVLSSLSGAWRSMERWRRYQLNLLPKISVINLFYPIVNLNVGGGIYCRDALFADAEKALIQNVSDIEKLMPSLIVPRKLSIYQDCYDQVADFSATLSLGKALYEKGHCLSMHVTDGARHGHEYLNAVLSCYDVLSK